MIYRTPIAFILFLISFHCYAQKNETPGIHELMQKSIQFYENNPRFSIALEYTFFRDKEHPKIIESYKGLLQKYDQNTYLKIHQTEFLSNEDRFLKVNHLQKAIQYQTTNNKGLPASPIQIDYYLKNFSTKEVYAEKDYWVCKLSTPVITQLPYGTIWIYVDQKTFAVKKQVMELTAPKGYKDEKGKYTMDLKYLEIKFSNYSDKIENAAHLRFENYVFQNKGKAQLTSPFKEYELFTQIN